MNDNKYEYTPLSTPIPITEQNWLEGTLPLVHTNTYTYNHEDYISECIEGILMQKTTFPVLVLIHDDASTDKTADIIREYEKKYSKLIKAYYQKENSHRSNNKQEMRTPFKNWQIGKYHASCEGDDYWADPYKLQKQIDFLEANPDYSLCVGGFILSDIEKNEQHIVIKRVKPNNQDMPGYTFTLKDMQDSWITKTLTAVISRKAYNNLDIPNYKYRRDIHLYYHIMKTGKGFYFTEVFGVYNVHEGGINSMKSRDHNSSVAYNCYKELYLHNRDEFTRIKYLKQVRGQLRRNLKRAYDIRLWFKSLSLSYELLTLISTRLGNTSNS